MSLTAAGRRWCRAAGCPRTVGAANNPLAMAPATMAPAILRGEFTMLSAINCCSIHDKNASIPLVTMSRFTLTERVDVYAAESVPLGCSSRIRCRHLLKTFWIGAGGWADRQLSDGTVVWTAPSGQTYTTTPAGAEFFPQLGVPTGEFAAATHHRAALRRARGDDADPQTRPRPGRGPNESRWNDNTTRNACRQEHRQRPAWLATTYERPPF